jgi:hypothetical protein
VSYGVPHCVYDVLTCVSIANLYNRRRLFISACRTIYHPSFCCRDLLPDVPDEGGYLRAVQT